jgi:hypothetical protein
MLEVQMLRSLICGLLALVVNQPANALLVGTELEAFDHQFPYVSAFGFGSAGAENVATYDPALDLLYMLPLSGPADFRVVPVDGSQAIYFSAAMSLVMNIDESRQSSGGIFSLIGTVPELGISTPSVLLAGSITDANIWSGSDNGSGFAPMEFFIQLNYSNPNFGSWGTEAVLINGLSVPVPSPPLVPITTADMFQKAWSTTSFDYWDLWSVKVPEPGTLSLIVSGVIALGMMRRRKLLA